MGFVLKALNEALAAGSALGALLPAGVLTSDSAQRWRRALLDRANLRLLASLGRHRLFPHAVVQVAGLVLSKGGSEDPESKVLTLRVGADEPTAAEDPLRALRGHREGSEASGAGGTWELFEAPVHAFAGRPTWRPVSPSRLNALADMSRQRLRRVSEVFRVRRGILTGSNRAFLVKGKMYRELPANERSYFRPAIVNESLHNARLFEGTWVFYPYDEDGSLPKTEDALEAAVPQYYRRHLSRFHVKRAKRSTLLRGKNWWELKQPGLDWTLQPEAKLVSKFFGGSGAFAVDPDSTFIVVEGHAWILKAEPESDEDSVMSDSKRMLCAYCALLNSGYFRTLLSVFAVKQIPKFGQQTACAARVLLRGRHTYARPTLALRTATGELPRMWPEVPPHSRRLHQGTGWLVALQWACWAAETVTRKPPVS